MYPERGLGYSSKKFSKHGKVCNDFCIFYLEMTKKFDNHQRYVFSCFEISLNYPSHCFLFVSLENLISKIKARLYCGLLHNIFTPTIYVKFSVTTCMIYVGIANAKLWDICRLLSLAAWGVSAGRK